MPYFGGIIKSPERGIEHLSYLTLNQLICSPFICRRFSCRNTTNAQIALQLDISPESVKTQIARMFEKLGAASRSEAVTIALRRYLLKI